jgi:saccharopine dehydrogenase-like NADP-dependent oxidoreductase
VKRVLIVGGAGVFGRRLAKGLRETTSAYVILAGRSRQNAERAAAETGAQEVVVLDRDRATPDDVRATGADLVIDAAGPFQGADLRFARTVIEAGVHYLDLADARDFVAAFPSLDALAREKGVSAVTGASSTPALTHAVLEQLCAGWRRFDIIRAGIAPANKMDRGPSVMRAILSWVGAPVRVFEGGAWTTRSGWSDYGRIDVPGLGVRRFALTEVPDLDLIPARFKPRDAGLFMAGLELPLMQRGMEAVAALRRWGIVRDLVRWADVLRRLGDVLLPFGSDRGGMIVEAFGRDGDDRPVRARWSMVARDGFGPYTPTFAALILARRFVEDDPPALGAHACVAMVRLEEFGAEFTRHKFETHTDVTPLTSPFELALGEAFETLAPAVRAAHRAGPVTRLRGEARVTGVATPIAALAAWLFGMPRTKRGVVVDVTKRHWGDKETWTRSFDGRRMESRLRFVRPGIVSESFGPFTFDMKVSAEAGVLSMTIVGWRMGVVPLPSFLAPRSTATESQDEAGRFRFDVPIALPLVGRLTHYSGWLEVQD